MIYILRSTRSGSHTLPYLIETAAGVRRERDRIDALVGLIQAAAASDGLAVRLYHREWITGRAAVGLAVERMMPGGDAALAAIHRRFAGIAIVDRVGYDHRTGLRNPALGFCVPPEGETRWFAGCPTPLMRRASASAPPDHSRQLCEELRAFVAEDGIPWDGSGAELMGVKGPGSSDPGVPRPVKLSDGIRRHPR